MFQKISLKTYHENHQIKIILSKRYPLDRGRLKDPLLTFSPLLFTFWARRQLKLNPGFDALSLEETKIFFKLLRKKDKNPPYRLSGYQ